METQKFVIDLMVSLALVILFITIQNRIWHKIHKAIVANIEASKTQPPVEEVIPSVSTEIQLPVPAETKEATFPSGRYHLVLGTAEILRQAELAPHVKVTSQEDWDAATKEEEKRCVKYGRSVIEITADYGRFLYRNLIVPYQPECLCVITVSWGLHFAAMTPEHYCAAYWK